MVGTPAGGSACRILAQQAMLPEGNSAPSRMRGGRSHSRGARRRPSPSFPGQRGCVTLDAGVSNPAVKPMQKLTPLVPEVEVVPSPELTALQAMEAQLQASGSVRAHGFPPAPLTRPRIRSRAQG